MLISFDRAELYSELASHPWVDEMPLLMRLISLKSCAFKKCLLTFFVFVFFCEKAEIFTLNTFLLTLNG